MNVAFGGTLHQKVHEVAGKLDHREDESCLWRCSTGRRTK